MGPLKDKLYYDEIMKMFEIISLQISAIFWKCFKLGWRLNLDRCSTWEVCFAFYLDLSKGWSVSIFFNISNQFPRSIMSINIRHRAHWSKSVSQIFLKGGQKKTYQEMLGLRHMKKENQLQHEEHCSSVSARSALSWNTSQASLASPVFNKVIN